MHLGDGTAELLFYAKEKELTLMSKLGGWKHMGATPYEDPYDSEESRTDKGNSGAMPAASL